MPVIRDPEYLRDIDVLVIESTYGGREHEKIEDLEARLAEIVNRTAARGGKIVVPSFALGRTQEILYSLSRLRKAGSIPELPIFVDSPLAVRITNVFHKHTELFDEEALREGMSFLEEDFGVKFTVSKEESQEINDVAGSCIIIASSGMCEAGRVLHHLMRTIEDPKNTILFVGFQAGHTLGKKILDGEPRVRILDGSYSVRAEVTKLNAYSAHAGKSDLLDFIRNAGPIKDLVLVHGEGLQLQALADAVPSVTGAKIHIPQMGDELEF
jgi:metallo-beta-lactamase family protein